MFELSPINPAQLQKKLEQKALEERKNREEAAANILTIHKMLEEAKKLGIEVKPYEEGLKEVQKHMRERLFGDAARKSAEVIKEIREGVKAISDEKVSLLESLVEREEKAGMGAGELKDVLDKVRKYIENNDYFIAIKMAEEGIESGKKRAASFANSIIEETEKLISALKDVANTEEAEKLLGEAKEKMKSEDVIEVISLCEKARETLKDVAEAAIERLSTEAELDITILERMGENVKPYEDRLKKAKKEGGPDAISDILEIGRVVREAVRVTLTAGIEELASEVEEIKDMGGDYEEILRYVEKAKENLEKNNLALAAETVEKGKKAVQEVKFNMVVKAMNPAFSKMKAANKIGADISEPERILLDARNALKIGEYRKAMELSRKCEEVLDDILESYKKTTETLSELETLFVESEKAGSDTKEAKKLLVMVKDALSKRDFRKAYALTLKTKEALQKGKLEGIKEKIKLGKKLVEIGEAEGIEVVEGEVAIQEAEKALEQGDLEKARKMAEDGLKDLKERIGSTLSSLYK